MNRGIDLLFLRRALASANTVYSIHKSNPKTLEIIRKIAEENNFKLEILTSKYRLKAYYPWHKKRIHEFLVDLYLFTKPSS